MLQPLIRMNQKSHHALADLLRTVVVMALLAVFAAAASTTLADEPAAGEAEAVEEVTAPQRTIDVAESSIEGMIVGRDGRGHFLAWADGPKENANVSARLLRAKSGFGISESNLTTVLDFRDLTDNLPATADGVTHKLFVDNQGVIYVRLEWADAGETKRLTAYYDPRLGATGLTDDKLVVTGQQSPTVGKMAVSDAAASRYLAEALKWCDQAEAGLPDVIAVAEIIADRHIAGGIIGTDWNNQTLGPEITGRAGGIIHIGFDRAWKKDRTDEEKSHDVAILGWDRGLGKYNVAKVQELKDRGVYIVGFGPKLGPEISQVVPLCDVFFDTGYGVPDTAIEVGEQSIGRANHIVSSIRAWTLVGEIVSALTRRGKMPTMWLSYSKPLGKEWADRYFGKTQFHDDIDVPAIEPGVVGLAYIDRMRFFIGSLRVQELGNLIKAAELVKAELDEGRKTELAWSGHMGHVYLGKGDQARWANAFEYHAFLDNQRQRYAEKSEEGALVIRVGYHGFDPLGRDQMRELKKRLILMAGEHDQPDWQPADDLLVYINLGWAFGDACVTIPGYPIPILAPSGVVQAVAIEAIDVQVAELEHAAAE